MTNRASWTAIAINGAAAEATDFVQVIVQDPESPRAGTMRADTVELEGAVALGELEDFARERRIRQLASAVEVHPGDLALTLTGRLRKALARAGVAQPWPSEGVTLTTLADDGNVEVGAGSRSALNSVRATWAEALLRSADVAGQQYAEALASGSADEESRALDDMREAARLGTLCARSEDLYDFRLRIAYTQAHRLDVVGLQRTYELAIRRTWDMSREAFERDIQALHRLFVNKVEARRLGKQALEASSNVVLYEERLVASELGPTSGTGEETLNEPRHVAEEKAPAASG